MNPYRASPVYDAEPDPFPDESLYRAPSGWMRDQCMKTIGELRALGVESASFYTDGTLHTVVLGPDPTAAPKGDEPNDEKPVQPRRAPTAGLITRRVAQPDRE